MTPEELDAIEARVAKATAGPWEWRGRGGQLYRVKDDGKFAELVMWPSHEYDRDMDIEGEETDLSFIAAARQDVPSLVAEVRRLREALGQHKALMLETANEFEKFKAAMRTRIQS